MAVYVLEILDPESMVEYEGLPADLLPIMEQVAGCESFPSKTEFHSYMDELVRKIEEHGYMAFWDLLPSKELPLSDIVYIGIDCKAWSRDVMFGFIDNDIHFNAGV